MGGLWRKKWLLEHENSPKKVYSNIDAMIEKIRLDNILFLDIEVPEAADFNELDAEMKDLWEHKTNSEKTNILLKSSMTERDLG
jgi:hypothetical protein